MPLQLFPSPSNLQATSAVYVIIMVFILDSRAHDRLAAAARASAAAQEARVVSWDAARVKATLCERFERNHRSVLRSFKKYDRDRSGRRVGVGMSTARQRARTRSHRVGFSY